MREVYVGRLARTRPRSPRGFPRSNGHRPLLWKGRNSCIPLARSIGSGTARVASPNQVPEARLAGTFWYHPHTNEAVQIERGLSGALIVRGDDEPVLDGEQIIVFDDLKLDRRGGLANFGGLIQWHDGREGDTRLVNGQCEPKLAIAAGQIERWRIVNASSARYVRLSIGGAPFQILGTDGGLLEAAVPATEVLLLPAKRVDLAVGGFEEGEELAIEAPAYWRTTIRRRKTERFATLKVGPAKPSTASIPERLRTIAPLADATTPPTRVVEFGVKYSLTRGMDFVVNKEMHHRDAPVKVGELQVWDVVNSTLKDHPFHLHGFCFQVLAVNGKPPAWPLTPSGFAGFSLNSGVRKPG